MRQYKDNSRTEPTEASATPPRRPTVILPCRGLDPELESCIRGLLDQSHDNYELILVTTSDDESRPLLSSFAMSHGDRVRFLLAPHTPAWRAQKLTNMLYALDHLREDSDAMVFVDSDMEPDTQFLSNLLCGLADPGVGVTTGFRWYVPLRNNIPSLLRSVWNAAGLDMLRNEQHSFAWGGAMAMRRADFDRLGVADRWEGALSDDLTLTAAVREAGLRVHFERRCVVACQGACSFAELEEWTTRQTKILRVYAPSAFRFAAATNSGAALGIAALAVFVALTGMWLPALAVLLAVFSMHWSRFAKLHGIAAACLGEKLRRPEVAPLWQFLAVVPLTLALYIVNLSRAVSSRCIVWRGIRYRLVSDSETQVLSDSGYRQATPAEHPKAHGSAQGSRAELGHIALPNARARQAVSK